MPVGQNLNNDMTENEKKRIEKEVYEFLSHRVSGTVPLDMSDLFNELAYRIYTIAQAEVGKRITQENLDDLQYLVSDFGDGGSITEEDEKVLARYGEFYEFLSSLRNLGNE